MASRSQASLFLQLSIRPALQKIGMWTTASEQLLVGTALVESDLLHRRQMGGGRPEVFSDGAGHS